jgi:hypothetical protein
MVRRIGDKQEESEGIDMSKNESIMFLETALKEHGEDCILCAAKDILITKAIKLIIEANSEPAQLTKDMEETLRNLRFWKDHPHAGLPSYIAKAENGLTKACAEIDRLTAENKLLNDRLNKAASDGMKVMGFTESEPEPTETEAEKLFRIEIREVLEAIIRRGGEKT